MKSCFGTTSSWPALKEKKTDPSRTAQVKRNLKPFQERERLYLEDVLTSLRLLFWMTFSMPSSKVLIIRTTEQKYIYVDFKMQKYEKNSVMSRFSVLKC